MNRKVPKCIGAMRITKPLVLLGVVVLFWLNFLEYVVGQFALPIPAPFPLPGALPAQPPSYFKPQEANDYSSMMFNDAASDSYAASREFHAGVNKPYYAEMADVSSGGYSRGDRSYARQEAYQVQGDHGIRNENTGAVVTHIDVPPENPSVESS